MLHFFTRESAAFLFYFFFLYSRSRAGKEGGDGSAAFFDSFDTQVFLGLSYGGVDAALQQIGPTCLLA